MVYNDKGILPLGVVPFWCCSSSWVVFNIFLFFTAGFDPLVSSTIYSYSCQRPNKSPALVSSCLKWWWWIGSTGGLQNADSLLCRPSRGSRLGTFPRVLTGFVLYKPIPSRFCLLDRLNDKYTILLTLTCLYAKRNRKSTRWPVTVISPHMPELGKVGDVKIVKTHYAFRYLIPHEVVRKATPQDVVAYEAVKMKEATIQRALYRQALKRRQEILEGLGILTFKRTPSVREGDAKGRVFAGKPIDQELVVKVLRRLGVTDVAPECIKLPNSVLTFGVHFVDIVLCQEVTASVALKVVSDRPLAEGLLKKEPLKHGKPR